MTMGTEHQTQADETADANAHSLQAHWRNVVGRLMQTAWLQRANHPHCLLFFSGWGMDPEPFRFLHARSCDVFLVHDYRQLQPLDLEPLAGYRHVHLVAWSMGVWVAAHLLGDRAGAFVSRTALAGTLNPIDAGRGLPPSPGAAR